MNIHYFIKKTVKILMAIAVTSTLVLTPLMITISSDSNGKIVPNFEFHRALAVLNVGVLDNQQLNVSYISGNLVMTITGNITNINVLSTIRFVYQLPDELSGILTRSTFPSGAHIDYEIRSLLGLSGTIPSSNLSLDTTLKTVTGSVFSLFGLDVGSQVTATLTVPIASFPPITDGSMQFTGIVARDAIINLSILGSEGSSKEVTIPPPTINRVTDVSTSITGTGIAGDTVHLVTSRGSFNVVVNATNSYNITLPQTLPVGSTVTATQTSPEGFTSVEYSRNVEGVILEFYTVPANIPFQTTSFQYNNVTIPKVSTLSLTVRDTRGAGSQWKIKAQATGPLISTTSGKSLSSNALVFVNGTSVQSLVGQQVLVYPGTTQQELTIVSWDADKGLLIKMTPEDFLNIVPGDVYSTTINWTLEDTP